MSRIVLRIEVDVVGSDVGVAQSVANDFQIDPVALMYAGGASQPVN